ncbi:MAG: hypothetical protein JRN06_07215 [Nitrososphaerota archaeon]|nr:hypothetical protein [Nitrososphaerota archaeon]MDG7024430.1 hypothetical protein [Nitrososphaerota archaeon]
MAESPREVLARRIDRYLNPVLTAVCSFFFLLLVPMMPGSPVLPLLVAAALGLYSVRSSRRASYVFYLFVFASIVWQFLGFGLQSLLSTPLGLLASFLLLVPLAMNAANPRMSPSSLALTFLAVALMLTPEYFLSIPLIAAAVALDGLGSVATTVVTFILTLAPFLLIENALFYGTLAAGATAPPIVFGELAHLAANMRPPLQGLNVFLTGLPQDFVSPQSAQVVSFLTGEAYLMLVPVAVFAVIFGASASMAGVLTKVKDKLTAFARLSKVLRTVWPVVVTVTMTAVFSVLLVLLSSGSVGGYQIALGVDPLIAVGAMVAGALVMGTALSARVYLDEGLTAATTSRERLSAVLAESKKLLEEIRKVSEKVDAVAPSVGLRVEEGLVDQYSSYLSDVERQMDTAGAVAMNTWEGEIQVRILPTLKSLPDQIRVKVVNEVSSVTSLAESLNGTLEHLGIATRFPTAGDQVTAMDTEQALEAYAQFTGKLKSTVAELYGFYLEAAKALDKLLDKTVSEPPVNPSVLLSTSDYVTAMRLLGEEYSMNLNAQFSEDLKQKLSDVRGRLRRMSEALGDEGKGVEGYMDLGSPNPLESPQILKKVEALIAYLQSEAGRAVDESVRLGSMIGTMMPAATTVLKFATLAELESLRELRHESKALGPSLEGLSQFVGKATKVLVIHSESRKKDEENMIIVAQYPLARRLIHGLASRRQVISLRELPFQPDATHFYAKIYAAQEPAARYDEQGEALLIAHA